jgi:hypothetical protein
MIYGDGWRISLLHPAPHAAVLLKNVSKFVACVSCGSQVDFLRFLYKGTASFDLGGRILHIK